MTDRERLVDYAQQLLEVAAGEDDEVVAGLLSDLHPIFNDEKEEH